MSQQQQQQEEEHEVEEQQTLPIDDRVPEVEEEEEEDEAFASCEGSDNDRKRVIVEIAAPRGLEHKYRELSGACE